MSDYIMARKSDALDRVVKTGDALTAEQRISIGDAWQLRWSVPDALSQRKVAAILRDLANKLEVYSQPPKGMSEFEAMHMMKGARKLAQNRLQSLSRPLKNKSGEINR